MDADCHLQACKGCAPGLTRCICKGDKGVPGHSGIAGLRGVPGQPGDDGRTGPAGPKGQKGDQGNYGIFGKKGPRGEMGVDGFVGTPGIHVSVFAWRRSMIYIFFRVFQDHLVSLALQDSLAAMELMVVMEKWVLRAPRDPRDRLGHRDSKAPKENLVREA